MALLDVWAQQERKPLFELLGGARNPRRIPIKFSIGLREPEDAANIAAAKVKEGFTAIKVKVGPDSDKDLARVRAVREAIGPATKLNIDVNGGWTVERSLREIPRYLPYNLEYVEQPTPRWDIDGMAEVRAAAAAAGGLPIMADESVFAVSDAQQVIRKGAADLISIYPGKNGGILKSMQICKLAANAGIACHLGSNLEWDIGTAAMCHVAAACENVTVQRFPVDILGPLYYSVRPRTGAIRYERGHVHVPTGVGLGVSICGEDLEALLYKADR
jgi:muconate cycloisomerase